MGPIPIRTITLGESLMMARRQFRDTLGAAAMLLGGLCAPGLSFAAGSDEGGRRDLSTVYAERLSLVAGTRQDTAGPPTVMAELAGVARVGASELGQMRAGFALSNGISVDFGFTSSTFLNGGTTPVQTLNVTFNGSSSSYSGLATITNNGVTQTTNLTSAGGVTGVLTSLNNGLTSVQTTLGNTGLTTVITNQANNQIIQQLQTLNLTASGLKPILDQQAAQSILSNGLSAANILRGR